MAPLPVTNTARLWIKYTSVGREHELMFRLGEGADASVAASTAASVATILRPLMKDTDAFISARFATDGSVFSFPVAFTAVAGTNSDGTDPDEVANFASLSGRGPTGRKVKYTFFTPFRDAAAFGYRTGRQGAMLDLAEFIEDNPALIVDISGAAPILNGYENLGYNAYWQRQARKGA